MLPDAAAVDARRTGSSRVGVYTGVWTAGETLGLALGPGLFALALAIGRLPLEHRRRRRPARLRADRDHARLLGPAGRPGRHSASSGWSRYWLDAAQVDGQPDRPEQQHDRRRPRPAQGPAGRRPAGARRPDAGLRLRLRPARRRPDRPRGGRGVRRLQRARPDRVPEPAADGERPGRLRARSPRRTGHGGRHRHLGRHRVGAARGAGGARRASGCGRAPHGAARHRARGVPQGRALLRRGAGAGPGRRATSRADVAATEAAVDEAPDRTVLVVASAPSYAHGVIDPVTELAALAAARGIRCHVDACIGGWVLPYAARLGRAVPPWTFAVDGRHLDLGRPAQVRLRAQGHLAAAAPDRRSCAGRSSSRRRPGRATRC